MNNTYQTWLWRQALISVTQPLSCPVDSNDEDYLDELGHRKLGWRNFRRELTFSVSGQQKHLHTHIEPNWKKGLWIYKGVPQIGDALMDLAPRSLLKQQGFCIDLYTDNHLANLFSGDPWFDRVYDDPKLITNQDYDFVIMPSHKGRSLRHKSSVLPDHAWVSMHGLYTGPEFHRGKFATQRIIDLLRYKGKEMEFSHHQEQKLKPLDVHSARPANVTKIAFALGGVDALRTYNKWAPLAQGLLSRDKKIKITLLGSSNALGTAHSFIKECSDTFEVSNQVNKTGLAECRELIHQQDLLIAADGGLMHLGVTTKAKLVSLFHAGVSPRWRLSGSHLRSALQSATNEVSDVAVSAIVQTSIKTLTNDL